jgi:RNA polymerase sigma factor (TIGR02999 family)
MTWSEQGITEGGEFEELFAGLTAGDPGALDALFDAVYGELRRLARAQRARWQGDTTLNTTALVHELYLRLSRHPRWTVNDRGHFYALASRAMRQVLVNYAEQRQAAKRGGGVASVPLDSANPPRLEDANPISGEEAGRVLVVDRALRRLASVSQRSVRVVECRFFAGLSVPETAEALSVSVATVKRDWLLASTWLRDELEVAAGASPPDA